MEIEAPLQTASSAPGWQGDIMLFARDRGMRIRSVAGCSFAKDYTMLGA